MNAPRVVSVSVDSTHAFSKPHVDAIELIAGIGVRGDAHAGATVRHRSRVRKDASAPNLRQVHLVHRELFDELAGKGFVVGPGDIGENVATEGVDLLDLPTGTLLHLGDEAVVEVTGLRNPCAQLDAFQPGLMAATLDRSADGDLVRKAGVMSVVRHGGVVRPGDGIRVRLPDPPHRPLAPV
jgi:MOSC domain-containing protein YiiM